MVSFTGRSSRAIIIGLLLNVGLLFASPLDGQMGENVGLGRFRRQAMNPAKRWQQRTLNYYFDNATTVEHQQLAKRVINYIKGRVCVKFVLNATATNRVKIISDHSKPICESSGIGMVGGEQTISIGTNCKYMGHFAQVLMNALGFYNMEVRTDRDNKINITMDAVDPDYRNSLKKLTTDNSTNLFGYNYGSVLHSSYARYAYSGSRAFPIITKSMDDYATIGSGLISSYDLNLINTFYNCYNLCATKPACKNGGSINAYNCKNCNCPLGYTGGLCQYQDTAKGGTAVTATNAWKNLVFRVVGTSTICNPLGYTTLTYWINRPTSYKYLQVQITSVQVPTENCIPGCGAFGFEFKITNNKQMTGPRVCCNWFQNVTYSTAATPFVITGYTSTVNATLRIRYRAVQQDVSIHTRNMAFHQPDDLCPNNATTVSYTTAAPTTTMNVDYSDYTNGETETAGSDYTANTKETEATTTADSWETESTEAPTHRSTTVRVTNSEEPTTLAPSTAVPAATTTQTPEEQTTAEPANTTPAQTEATTEENCETEYTDAPSNAPTSAPAGGQTSAFPPSTKAPTTAVEPITTEAPTTQAPTTTIIETTTEEDCPAEY